LNPLFYSKAQEIVEQNQVHSLEKLGLTEEEYTMIASSKLIILPYWSKEKCWRLMALLNDQALPLPKQKATKRIEFFFLQSTPKIWRNDESSTVRVVEKAVAYLAGVMIVKLQNCMLLAM